MYGSDCTANVRALLLARTVWVQVRIGRYRKCMYEYCCSVMQDCTSATTLTKALYFWQGWGAKWGRSKLSWLVMYEIILQARSRAHAPNRSLLFWSVTEKEYSYPNVPSSYLVTTEVSFILRKMSMLQYRSRPKNINHRAWWGDRDSLNGFYYTDICGSVGFLYVVTEGQRTEVLLL